MQDSQVLLALAAQAFKLLLSNQSKSCCATISTFAAQAIQILLHKHLMSCRLTS
jgi:hypothetical protein